MAEVAHERVLLVSVGLSPQVVTETLHAIFAAGDPLPTRLVLLTTAQGALAIRDHLTDPSSGRIARWGREWDIPEASDLARNSEIVTIESDAGDLESSRALAGFAREAEGLIREITDRENTTLHVSIAGGRKTASAMLAVLMAIHGRSQDRVTHVFVSPEGVVGSDFFYPTRSSHRLFASGQRGIDSRNVKVRLVELPFSGLRFAESPNVRARVDQMMGCVLNTPRLRVSPARREVAWDGRSHVWPPQPTAFLAMLAEDRISNGSGIRRSGTSRARFLRHYKPASQARALNLPDPLEGEWVEEKVSRVNRLARLCDIRPGGGLLVRREGVRASSVYHLALDPSDVDLQRAEQGR